MDIKYKLIIELMLKVNLVKLLKWDCLLSKLLRNSCRIVFSNIQIQMHVSILLLARTESSRRLTRVELTPCSFGLSATSQQYFSLRTNQPPATSQQYFSLRTNQHQPSATSQTNRL
jgi:hypothetical protein